MLIAAASTRTMAVIAVHLARMMRDRRMSCFA